MDPRLTHQERRELAEIERDIPVIESGAVGFARGFDHEDATAEYLDRLRRRRDELRRKFGLA